MNIPLVPVVLCGGSGTRLWPLSREAFPKQFLRLSGDNSMLQQTLQRLTGIDALAPALLVCNESSRFIVAEQMREIGLNDARVLLEPMRRNTAPAIATAALQAMQNGEDPVLLVLPSDHVILDAPAFHRAIALARQAAEQGKLLTFGITPTGPETGYGYIRADGDAVGQARPITEFVEKPALALVEQYIASGDYFWNSGMFLFRASRYLEELERFQPAVVAACREALAKATRTPATIASRAMCCCRTAAIAWYMAIAAWSPPSACAIPLLWKRPMPYWSWMRRRHSIPRRW